jgi:hypothetical protein
VREPRAPTSRDDSNSRWMAVSTVTDFADSYPHKMRFSRLTTGWVALAFACAASPVACQEKAKPMQRFTGYPPSVYMRPSLACADDAQCTQMDKFHLDQVPTGCCVLIVTNGDGRGADEVRNYEVFLNGERVVPSDHSRTAQVPVKLKVNNMLKVVLNGGSHSKVFVLLAYDPRQSK